MNTEYADTLSTAAMPITRSVATATTVLKPTANYDGVRILHGCHASGGWNRKLHQQITPTTI
jgi:hypothetical protein